MNWRLKCLVNSAITIALSATLGVVSWPHASRGQTTQMQPNISVVHYGEWNDAVRMTNGTVELIVVPEIGGRIIRYGLVNGPNELWERPPASRHADHWFGWENWGGDKAWPWPQDDWIRHTKSAWPPPREFDQAAVTIRVIGPRQIEVITIPMTSYSGRRFLRSITLEAVGTRAVIETRLTPPTSQPTTQRSKQADQAAPVAAWEIAQVPVPSKLYLRNATVSATPNATLKERGSELFAVQSWHAEPLADQQIWQLTPRHAGRGEVFETNADALVSINDGIAFVQHDIPLPTPVGAAILRGEQSRVYIDDRTSNLDDHYVELEWIGPRVLSDLGGSDSVIRDEWSLIAVGGGVPDPANVLEMMAKP